MSDHDTTIEDEPLSAEHGRLYAFGCTGTDRKDGKAVSIVFRRKGALWESASGGSLQEEIRRLRACPVGAISYRYRGRYLRRFWNDPATQMAAFETLEGWMDSESSLVRALSQLADSHEVVNRALGVSLSIRDGEVYLDEKLLLDDRDSATAIIYALRGVGLPVRILARDGVHWTP